MPGVTGGGDGLSSSPANAANVSLAAAVAPLKASVNGSPALFSALAAPVAPTGFAGSYPAYATAWICQPAVTNVAPLPAVTVIGTGFAPTGAVKIAIPWDHVVGSCPSARFVNVRPGISPFVHYTKPSACPSLVRPQPAGIARLRDT